MTAKMMFESEKFIMPERKITEYLLKPGARHSSEFFDVGYTTRDGERLVRDMEAQFDKAKACDFRREPENTVFFSIFMQLGIRKSRTFRTVWMQKSFSKKPVFITAHREAEPNVGFHLMHRELQKKTK